MYNQKTQKTMKNLFVIAGIVVASLSISCSSDELYEEDELIYDNVQMNDSDVRIKPTRKEE